MNKYKKIATAVISIVMAGTMVGSLAACGGGGDDETELKTRSTVIPETRYNAAAADLTEKAVGSQGLKVSVTSDGKLAYPVGTEIVSNIVDSGNTDRHISYDNGQIATFWTSVDGYTYYGGDLKPAWWQLGQDLGVKFVDKAKTGRNGKEINEAKNGGELADYNLINSTVGFISADAASTWVNLRDFMEYMPNFKNFLNEYEIVEWSLQMDTDGAMYYIPYFDGNDDIEKYEMVQRDWVKVLLDEELPATDTSITYAEQLTAKNLTLTASAVKPFMGTTGSWKVDAVSANGTVGELEVNYNNVIEALKSGALHDAVVAAGVAAPQTASGNIVDIQNEMISATNGAVKGSDLVKVLREYIKVAYKLDGAAYTKLSDVFISQSAGWDADLMVAIFRCVVTNFKSFNGMSGAAAGEVYALAGREAKAQRQNDLIALAGELYGVRGLESRLDYYSIDASGNLQDARVNEASYEAANNLSALAKEGLLYTGTGSSADAVNKLYKAGNKVTFMLHDYVQTQTKDGFSKDTFDFAPILTPVSKWNDGTEKIMRFTESWRSVKNSGVVIPLASVTDSNKLSAVLSFVDYLFSNDGQIIGSYGPMATSNEAADGFWYGKNGVSVLNADGTVKAEYADKVTTVDNVQYFLKKEYRNTGFMYGNVFYEGMPYKDKQIPIMTDNNKNFYLGKEVNGVQMGATNAVGYAKNHVGNYTDYARGVVGAALPIGNKDQGFEYQCTADCGLNGAAVVNTAIQLGVIKHLTQTVSENTWWYTVVPSVLPVTSQQATDISGQIALNGDSKTVGIYNPTSTAGYTNVYIDLAFYGYGTYYIGTMHNTTEGDYQMKNSASELVEYVKSVTPDTLGVGALTNRNNWYSAAWNSLKTAKGK